MKDGDETKKEGTNESIRSQIQVLLTILKAAKKENIYIMELEKKKEEYRLKYENYKKLALKEKDEKDAKIKEFELLKKERADKPATNTDKKKEGDAE